MIMEVLGFFRFGCSDVVSRDEYSFIAPLERTDDTFVVFNSAATSEVVQGLYKICKLKILSKIHRFVGLEVFFFETVKISPQF